MAKLRRRSVRSLLVFLLVLATPSPTSNFVGAIEGPATVDPTPVDPNDVVAVEVQRALDRRINVEFVGVPFAAVLRQLEAKAGVRFVIDRTAPNEASISPKEPIFLRVRNVSTRNVLRLLNQPFTSRGGSVFLGFDRQRVTRRYPTAGLVLVDPEQGWRRSAAPLIDVASDLLTYEQCDLEAKGDFVFKVDEEARTLVVRASRGAHERLEGLFRALRKTRQDLNALLHASGCPDAETILKPGAENRPQIGLKAPP